MEQFIKKDKAMENAKVLKKQVEAEKQKKIV